MTRPCITLVLLCLWALACGPAPEAIAPAAPTAAVAGPPIAEGAEEAQGAGEPEEEGDPGPIPVTGDDPQWGRRDAPVTIVEFSDFQCPFCSRVRLTLAQLKETYGPAKIRIVWKNYPLSFHQDARGAADLATAIFARRGSQGFWMAHDALFDGQRDLPRAAEVAVQMSGASSEEIRAVGGRAMAKVDADMALGKKAGVSGTPAFFINGVHLSGAQPYEKFAAVVDEQLQKARAALAAGVRPGRVYAHLAGEQWVEKKPAASAPDPEDKTVWLVPVGKSPVRGKSTALVTIVEFSDYQCPFCKRVEPTLEQIQKEYGDKVRIVWKDSPLPFHPRAEPAAQLALEARAQRGDAAFFRVHDALFADQQHLDDASLEALAGAAGLDVKRAMKAVADHRHRRLIEEDQDLADDLQANGTPHFFINGRRLVGAQPIEKFRALIDEELPRAEALVKAGTAPARVYDKLQVGAKAAPAPERKAIPAPTKDNPSRGPASAKVVMQVFSDFQCPFCLRVRSTIEQIEQEFAGKIRVVWRNLPLSMHRDAEPAAEAAMEAFRQKGAPGFWAMHDLLFANQSQPGGLERPALEGYATQIGLDLGRFVNALDTSAHKGLVDADVKAAEDASISGTPAFVINGYFLSGAQPAAKFRKIVKLALGERP